MSPDKLIIDSTLIRLLINEGPDFIEFDPNDILFIEGFYALIQEFNTKQIQYEQRMKEFGEKTDGAGIPLSIGENIKTTKEVCVFARQKIDEMLGPGTSLKLFGERLAFHPIQQFFEGITPYIRKVRGQKLEKFMPPKPSRKRRHKSPR